MRNVVRGLKERLERLLSSRSERRHSMVGPVHLWKMKREFQIRFLKQVGIEPEHYLLDLGCGTLRGGIPLIQYLQEAHYYGIEVRAEVLEEGRKELRNVELEYKKPVLMHTEDISLLDIGKEFDFVWAFSVLFHMTDDILNDCLSFIRKHLKKTGCFYANVNIGESEDCAWQGFPVTQRRLEFYKEVGLRNGLHVSDMGPLRILGHVSNVRTQDEQRMLKFQIVG